MTPDEIKQLVQQQILALVPSMVTQNLNTGRFQLSSLPYHVHNGSDAPLVFSPTIVYAALINANGTININRPFPSNWKLAHPSTGLYVVEHDLGTTEYIVNATPIITNQVYVPAVAVISNPGTISVDIQWFDMTSYGDGNFTLTGNLLIGATTATLSVPWAYTSRFYDVNFSNGDTRSVSFVHGSTAISWTGGLSGAASSSITVLGVAPAFLDTNFFLTITDVTNTTARWPTYRNK